MKYGSLNFLKPSGPVQTCNGIVLPLPFTLAFASQLRKKHGKTSVRVTEECHLAN
jgi:hypothetical protein